MMQPDFGMALILLTLFACMMFVAEVNLKYILGLGFTSAEFAGFAVMSADYRLNRYFLLWIRGRIHLGRDIRLFNHLLLFVLAV